MTAPSHSLREPTGAYQISEAQGPLTPEERRLKQQRRQERRETAGVYLEQRRNGVERAQQCTLTSEELVEVERMAHEIIRAGEATHRSNLRKKCSSIRDLAAVRLPAVFEAEESKGW